MAISERDLKILWGRAAGRCSFPSCQLNLIPILKASGDTVLGEMAHIIGAQPGGPRGDPEIGRDDSYENLILLCPTHHTLVDKASADYPADLLRKWKRSWEECIALNVTTERHPSLEKWIVEHRASLRKQAQLEIQHLEKLKLAKQLDATEEVNKISREIQTERNRVAASLAINGIARSGKAEAMLREFEEEVKRRVARRKRDSEIEISEIDLKISAVRNFHS